MTGRAPLEGRARIVSGDSVHATGEGSTVMALSEYMPYGAPELLDGASPRMARATFMASGLVAAMVCALGVLVANRPATRELPPEMIRFDFQPNIYEPQPPSGHAPEISKIQPLAAEFHAVVDEPTQPVTIEEQPPSGPESSNRGDVPEAVRGGGDLAPTQSQDPLPTEFVYTDELPQPVRVVKPDYPDLAHDAGVEGTVKLQLLVGLDGHVLRAIVRRGGSVPMLDGPAIAAALQCVFTPALANGRPVKVWVTQDYRFTLH